MWFRLMSWNGQVLVLTFWSMLNTLNHVSIFWDRRTSFWTLHVCAFISSCKALPAYFFLCYWESLSNSLVWCNVLKFQLFSSFCVSILAGSSLKFCFHSLSKVSYTFKCVFKSPRRVVDVFEIILEHSLSNLSPLISSSLKISFALSGL